jgi:uncharacterized protein YqgC (DUF456 family)
METRLTDDKPRARIIMYVAAVAFFLAGVVNLLVPNWLNTAFYFAGGLLFLFGKGIDRLPRAARYLIVVIFAALAVAMFVEMIVGFRARG